MVGITQNEVVNVSLSVAMGNSLVALDGAPLERAAMISSLPFRHPRIPQLSSLDSLLLVLLGLCSRRSYQGEHELMHHRHSGS
jgi:hypothetical protein